MDRSQIIVVNQLSGDLNLRCLGHAPSNVTNLVWVSEQDGEEPVFLLPENNDNYTMVSYSSNEANVSIDNFIQPYRGILRCQSLMSNRQATFFVVECKLLPKMLSTMFNGLVEGYTRYFFFVIFLASPASTIIIITRRGTSRYCVHFIIPSFLAK